MGEARRGQVPTGIIGKIIVNMFLTNLLFNKNTYKILFII